MNCELYWAAHRLVTNPITSSAQIFPAVFVRCVSNHQRSIQHFLKPRLIHGHRFEAQRQLAPVHTSWWCPGCCARQIAGITFKHLLINGFLNNFWRD